jgi:hypothetical protein
MFGCGELVEGDEATRKCVEEPGRKKLKSSGDGKGCNCSSWNERIYKRTPYGMLRFILVLLV